MNLLSFLRKNSVNNQMRIFLTDDHAVLIGGLQKIIEAEHDLEIVGTAGDVQSTMDSLTHTKVDLLITDLFMP